MAKNAKGKSKTSGENNSPVVDTKKGALKGTLMTEPIQGFHKNADGFSLIDDEAITPRAFDRTLRGKKKEKGDFTFGESFGMVGNSFADVDSKLKDDAFDALINDKPEPFHLVSLNNKMHEINMDSTNRNAFQDYMARNNDSNTDGSEKETMDTNDSRRYGALGFNQNTTANNTGGNYGTNYSSNPSNTFDFRMDETPIKSNTAAGANNETESTTKKYRTPGEIDMLEPDDSLIGNKCITINNYVSPPKFVNRIGSFSRFPLSGEADINIMDYNGFRSLFKNCACVISEQEYLESSSKESNTNPMHSLREEETEAEHDERNAQDDGNQSDDNKGGKKNGKGFKNENDKRKQENRNEFYDMHETPNKYARSNTAFPSAGGNRFGSSPNKNLRRRGEKPLNTSKLLDALNIENDKNDKNKNSKKASDNDKTTGNNKKMKKGNEVDDKYIDFEIKPVFKKDMEGKEKEKENALQLSMEELAKKKKNTLKIILKPYSEDLNAVFKKDICELAKQIYHAYSTLNYVISRRNMLNEPLYFKIMRGELQRLGGGSYFTEDVLRQLAWIAPSLIVLNKIVVRKEILQKHFKEYPEHATGKRVEDIEVRENSNERPNIYKLSTKEKLEICQKSIIAWINVKHNEFLKKLNAEFYLPPYYELKKWHSEFNFDEVIFPSVKLTEDKVAARLSFTPHESNTDDFIVENDSPLKTVMVDFESHQHFVNDMEQERTRTPLGRNKRKSAFGSPFASPFNLGTPKKETKNMKLIREDANKKKIISEIKNELDSEEQKLLSEKKYWENAKWIAEIIHDTFVVEGIYTVIELLAFAKKIANKYKNTQMFDMDEKKIAEIIEVLATYIPDISIKPAITDKTKTNLSVKSKKNLHFFLEPVTKKAETMTKRYLDVKANKETRLRELWNKHEVPFELAPNMKKFFLNPGSITIADL